MRRFLVVLNPKAGLKRGVHQLKKIQKILEKKEWLSNLQEGDRVKHNILGQGTVLKVDSIKHIYEVLFDNMTTPRKMSFKAPLEKL